MANIEKHIYRVLFHNQSQIFDVYVRGIYTSDIFGFVEMEDFVFRNESHVVIDPAEDKLRQEFESVRRVFVPMQAIIRIDEVEKEGTPKITDGTGTNIATFPIPMPTKPKA